MKIVTVVDTTTPYIVIHNITH